MLKWLGEGLMTNKLTSAERSSIILIIGFFSYEFLRFAQGRLGVYGVFYDLMFIIAWTIITIGIKRLVIRFLLNFNGGKKWENI